MFHFRDATTTILLCFYKTRCQIFFIASFRFETKEIQLQDIYTHIIHTISVEPSFKFLTSNQIHYDSNSMIEFHRIFFFAKFNDMSTNHVTRSIAITIAAPFEIPFVNSIEMIRVPSLKKAITLFFHARLYTRDGRSNRDRNGTSTQRIRAWSRLTMSESFEAAKANGKQADCRRLSNRASKRQLFCSYPRSRFPVIEHQLPLARVAPVISHPSSLFFLLPGTRKTINESSIERIVSYLFRDDESTLILGDALLPAIIIWRL